jgi:hypothetical protein
MANPGNTQDPFGIGNLIKQYKGHAQNALRQINGQARQSQQFVHEKQEELRHNVQEGFRAADRVVAPVHLPEMQREVREAEKEAHHAVQQNQQHLWERVDQSSQQLRAVLHDPNLPQKIDKEGIKTVLDPVFNSAQAGYETTPLYEAERTLSNLQKKVDQQMPKVLHDGQDQAEKMFRQGMRAAYPYLDAADGALPLKEQLNATSQLINDKKEEFHQNFRNWAEAPCPDWLQQIHDVTRNTAKEMRTETLGIVQGVNDALPTEALQSTKERFHHNANELEYLSDRTGTTKLANTVQNVEMIRSAPRDIAALSSAAQRFFTNPEAQKQFVNVMKHEAEEHAMQRAVAAQPHSPLPHPAPPVANPEAIAPQPHAPIYDPGLPPRAAGATPPSAGGEEVPKAGSSTPDQPGGYQGGHYGDANFWREQEDIAFANKYAREHPNLPEIKEQAAGLLKGTNGEGLAAKDFVGKSNDDCQSCTIAAFRRLYGQDRVVVTADPYQRDWQGRIRQPEPGEARPPIGYSRMDPRRNGSPAWAGSEEKQERPGRPTENSATLSGL